jgi:phenylacetate-CoA ligase
MSIARLVPAIACRVYQSLWPRLRPGGYFSRYQGALRRRQGLDRQSPQSVWARQKDKLNSLVSLAVEHVPYYRRLAQAGMMPRRIDTPGDLGAIPILTKEIIRREGETLLAENFPRHMLRRNATGGSTGQPMQYWSDEINLLLGNAGEAWAMSLAGLEPSGSLAYLWGAARLEKHFRKDLREGLTRLINNCIFIDCFKMSRDDLRAAHRRLTRFRPEGFIGYTSALVELATFLRQEGIQPRYPRKAVLSAAETLDDVSRRTLEDVFGAGVYNRYGSREIGPVAMECDRHEGLHVDCENLHVELIEDPEGTGKHRIVVTKLNQHSMVILRYDTEDLADGPLAHCSCGRGYPMLRRVVGRVTEMIRMPTGACLPGELFPHLFKDCGIAGYQVVQQADYSLKISLVKTASQTPEQRQMLERVVRERVGQSLRTEFIYVDRIERSASGKLLPVRSFAPRTGATSEVR